MRPIFLSHLYSLAWSTLMTMSHSEKHLAENTVTVHSVGVNLHLSTVNWTLERIQLTKLASWVSTLANEWLARWSHLNIISLLFFYPSPSRDVNEKNKMARTNHHRKGNDKAEIAIEYMLIYKTYRKNPENAFWLDCLSFIFLIKPGWHLLATDDSSW